MRRVVLPMTGVGWMLLAAGAVVALVAAVSCTKEQLKTEATTAKTELVNCTAQDLGTAPKLDLATLVAVANLVIVERARCTPAGGSLSWSCVERDLIAEGKTLGGCTFVRLVADALSASKPTAVELVAGPTTAPGGAELAAFRAKVAPGVALKYHTAAGDF